MKNISWNGILNIAYNYNEVINYDFGNPIVGNYLGRGDYFLEGKPTDYFTAYKYKGVDKRGVPIVNIKGKDIIVDSNIPSFTIDYTGGENVTDYLEYQGRTTPLVNTSFINSFDIYNFSLNIIMSGSFGHIFRMPGIYSSNSILQGTFNTSKNTKEGWTPNNKTNIPATSPTKGVNDQLYKDFGGQWANYYNNGSASIRNASHVN